METKVTLGQGKSNAEALEGLFKLKGSTVAVEKFGEKTGAPWREDDLVVKLNGKTTIFFFEKNSYYLLSEALEIALKNSAADRLVIIQHKDSQAIGQEQIVANGNQIFCFKQFPHPRDTAIFCQVLASCPDFQPISLHRCVYSYLNAVGF